MNKKENGERKRKKHYVGGRIKIVFWEASVGHLAVTGERVVREGGEKTLGS